MLSRLPTNANERSVVAETIDLLRCAGATKKVGCGALAPALILVFATAFAAMVNAQDGVGVPLPANKSAAQLDNLHQVSKRILSGSEPHSPAAFGYLKAAGISTVVSVDGAKPDVAAAKAAGLRYVHVPIGYDAIPKRAQLSLLRILRETTGGVYIHCHHGKHRGPAAAAIACRLEGTADHDAAVNIMKQAGTSLDYAGLWRDVREFEPPSVDSPLPQLTETANVESMAAAMARLSRHVDSLKQIQAADWQPPVHHPDVVPVEEAVLVTEAFRETSRHLQKDVDEQFRDWLKESEALAQQLHAAVKSKNTATANRTLNSLQQNCRQCHQAYRN